MKTSIPLKVLFEMKNQLFYHAGCLKGAALWAKEEWMTKADMADAINNSANSISEIAQHLSELLSHLAG